MAASSIERQFFQSYAQKRWDDHLHVQLALKKFPRGTRLEHLRNVIKVCGELGKGVYGVVYEAKINQLAQGGSGSSIAIKSISTLDRPNDRETIFSRMLREEIAYAYLNALVFLRICPNFALVHKSFLSRHQQRNNMYCFLMCMEKADGNMREWIASKHGYVEESHAIMSAIFQIFMACFSLKCKFGHFKKSLSSETCLTNYVFRLDRIPEILNSKYACSNKASL